MTHPKCSISPKEFSLVNPNPPFKIFGDDLDALTLLAARPTSNHCEWPEFAVIVDQKKQFIKLRADPKPLPVPLAAPAPGGPAGAAPVFAPGGDLTITLTFDDDSGGTTDVVTIYNDITYTDP